MTIAYTYPWLSCKTVVTPMLMHWSYHSLALSHQYDHVNIAMRNICSEQHPRWHGSLGQRWTNITNIAQKAQVHGANVGPTWVLTAPDGPHAGPMNLAIRVGQRWLPLGWVSILPWMHRWEAAIHHRYPINFHAGIMSQYPPYQATVLIFWGSNSNDWS